MRVRAATLAREFLVLSEDKFSAIDASAQHSDIENGVKPTHASCSMSFMQSVLHAPLAALRPAHMNARKPGMEPIPAKANAKRCRLVPSFMWVKILCHTGIFPVSLASFFIWDALAFAEN